MPGAVKNRAIRYRLYPTNEQKILFAQTFGCVRLVYNSALTFQEELHQAGLPALDNRTMNTYCNRVWKDEHPFLRDVDKFALTNSIFSLGAARKNFFEGRAKHPRYKSRKDPKQSYTTNMTNGNIQIVMPVHRGDHRGYIQLPKLGNVPANIHRRPAENQTIKSATVSLNAGGRYYVSILFASPVAEDIPERPIPSIDRVLGLDYSSPHFYVDSEGRSADMPHFYRKAEKRLAIEQRRLSRMEKGSNNSWKQRMKIARICTHVAGQRKDFCHKLSREIANSYDAVCVEDIDLRAMSQTLSLGKSTMDNGFGMFRTFLRYKLEDQGKDFVVIDKWYPSTKTCNSCKGYNGSVKLGQETWVCPKCGRTVLRDYNAALNIREKGLEVLKEHRRQEALGQQAAAAG